LGFAIETEDKVKEIIHWKASGLPHLIEHDDDHIEHLHHEPGFKYDSIKTHYVESIEIKFDFEVRTETHFYFTFRDTIVDLGGQLSIFNVVV
jgi:hypothetical protein